MVRRTRRNDSPAQELVDQLIAAHAGDVDAAMNSLRSYLLPAMLGRQPSFGNDQGRHGGRASFTPIQPPAAPVTLRVRVDIDEAKPPIWRRLDLAGDLTLTQVHRAIQAAFGWADCHLHRFTPEFDGRRDMTGPGFANEDDVDDDGADSLGSEGDVRLDAVVAKPGDRLFYEYDFGDGWILTLQVEQVRPRGDEPAAACVGGRRAGPPEDCGGIWRYNDIVEALGGADDPSADEPVVDEDELTEFLAWVGEDFDPAAADLDGLEDLDDVVVGRYPVPAATDGGAGDDDPDDPDDLDDLHHLFAEGERAFWESLPADPRLAQSLRELIEEADAADLLEPVGDLISGADLDVLGMPVGAPRAGLFASLPRAEAEGVTRPWRDLVAAIDGGSMRLSGRGLQLGGTDGADGALFTLEPTDDADTAPWATPQVILAGATLGLLRKSRGAFVVTKAGRVAAGDPIRMWRHLADRLTRGVTLRDRLLAAMALLTLAADDPTHPAGATMAAPRDVFGQTATSVLPRLGNFGADWTKPTVHRVLDATETVWVLFTISGGLDAEGRATAAGRRLARAALLS